MNPAASSPPLLVLLGRGVGPDDRAAISALRELCPAAPQLVAPIAGRNPTTTVANRALVEELRRAAVTVDRRSLHVRPRWRSDAAELFALGAYRDRPDVTFLELRDAAVAAAQHGLDSAEHLAALAELPHTAQRAAALLRAGPAPVEIAFVALGRFEPVHTICDPLPLLPRRARRRARFDSKLLRVRFANWCAAETLARHLDGELTRHGRRLTSEEATNLGAPPDELWWLANPGTALRETRAAPPVLAERSQRGLALLPWSRTQIELTPADLTARLLMRGSHHARELEPLPVPTGAEDLAMVLEHSMSLDVALDNDG